MEKGKIIVDLKRIEDEAKDLEDLVFGYDTPNDDIFQ